MNNVITAALLALALSGCTPPPLAPAPPVSLSERARLEFGGGWEPDRRERRSMARALDLAERAYLALEGGSAPRVSRVILYPGWRLPAEVSARVPGTLRGMCEWGAAGSTIHLATGGRWPMLAAPHELRHARIGDPDHERSGWRAVDRIGRWSF